MRVGLTGGIGSGKSAAASMLAAIRGQLRCSGRPSGASVILANSGQARTDSSDHWMEVWWSLFFFTPTVARQSRQATSVTRADV